EFQEGLREDLLAAIAVHHRLVVDHVMRRSRDGTRRDALRDSVAVELVEPVLEACALVAGRALRLRGCRDDEGGECRRDDATAPQWVAPRSGTAPCPARRPTDA